MAEAEGYHREQRRRHGEAVLRAAIAAADPAPLVERALRGAVELAPDAGVRLIAIGKAAPAMAGAALRVLGDGVRNGLIIAPHGTPAPAGTIFGGHPVPDEGSLAAGHAVVDELQAAGPGETVVVLLSGGASACVALPLGDITVTAYADCITRLMHAGADITQLNTVRKHIDALKGGRMARIAEPVPVLGLVLSDVVGDPVEIIASGPLSPDPTSAEDALRILQHYALLDECDPAIRAVLESDAGESPDEEDPAFATVRVRVIGGNDVAVEGAAAAAGELGYRVRRATEPVTGPAREAGATLAREARTLQGGDELPVCIVAGGETTMAVQGDGRGGRNQELVLAACLELDGRAGITVASVGTDGVDGNTDAAGAIADEFSPAAAAAADIDVRAILDGNDSYAYFAATDGLIMTGPTGTNVNDVHIALIAPPGPGPLLP